MFTELATGTQISLLAFLTIVVGGVLSLANRALGKRNGNKALSVLSEIVGIQREVASGIVSIKDQSTTNTKTLVVVKELLVRADTREDERIRANIEFRSTLSKISTSLEVLSRSS